MNITPAQEEFVRRFQEYEKNQAAYKSLSNFLRARSFGELRDCLSIYFEGEVYKPYVDKDGHKRALTVFYDLCFNVLSRSAPGEDLYFALRLEALVQNKSGIWHSFFVELDIKQQRTLTSRISRQKAKLSSKQKDFLREFDLLMQQGSKQGAKRFADRVLTVKKIEPLNDCLRAYVEVSQKYSDNDKDSLNAFYAISYYALGVAHRIGDSYFAAKYESLVHSEGTVWKRRYDALDAHQRDDQLVPAIREAKQVVIEKKGSVGGKELTASEKFTVPPLSPASPDLEKKGRVSLPTETQRKFIDLFRKFMDSRDAKPKALTDYVFNLSRQRFYQQLTECVEAYLQASTKYDEKDVRSLYVFFGTASLAIRANDAYYAAKFNASIHTSGTTLAKRFAALKPSDQASLRADLDKMLKNPRILDELKFAYFQKEKKEPTLQALRTFEFANSPEFAFFSNVLDKFLDECNRAYEFHRADDFSVALDALANLLLAQKNRLLFVTLLKRCREAKGLGTILRHQLYWYGVGVLYIRALGAEPEIYAKGFSPEEKQFFFDGTEVADPYFADFVVRLEYLWTHRGGTDEFSQAIKAYCKLLLFAGQIGASFVPLVQTAQVHGLVEELIKEKGHGFLYEMRIPINSRYDRGKTLSVHGPVGKHFIVWSDSSGTYVELENFEGLLFRVDSEWLGRVYDNDAVWGEIYRSTKGLLVAIPLLFQVLGYLPDFVSGGVTGLVKSVLINVAIEKTADALGLNSTAVQLALLGAVLITHHALSRKKTAPAKDARLLDRGTEALGHDNAIQIKGIEAAGINPTVVQLPGPAADFPFGSGRQPLPKPGRPNKVYRIMSVDEFSQAAKTSKLPPTAKGTESSKWLSLDSDYSMLFREKELDDLARKTSSHIESAEDNLKKVETRIAELRKAGRDTTGLTARAKELQAEIERRGAANKALADPVIKDWFEAPGQKVVVEVELEPGALDDILNHAVDKKLIGSYKGKNAYAWAFERGYGRNIGIPGWQLDKFNSKVRAIRFYAERGTHTFGPRKIPSGIN